MAPPAMVNIDSSTVCEGSLGALEDPKSDRPLFFVHGEVGFCWPGGPLSI
jgi:hypothetical protein